MRFTKWLRRDRESARGAKDAAKIIFDDFALIFMIMSSRFSSRHRAFAVSLFTNSSQFQGLRKIIEYSEENDYLLAI
jgi:hypothetical protein